MTETHARGARAISAIRILFPGILVSALIAMAAQFVSEHYGAPAMLMALTFGMALNFLSEPGSSSAPGIAFTARDVLKIGVVLLGARISFEMVVELGWQTFALVVTATITTLLAGLTIGRLMRKEAAFSLLTAGAVAICGASAALAISSVLPKTEKSEQQLFFTVLCVTLLSTLAMIFYPVALGAMDLSDTESGIFLGATIHDVAQVVGAGFLISDDAGKTATLVKLTRVALLAPLVIVLSVLMRRKPDPAAPKSSRPPILPLFVAGFIALAALNSFGLIPEAATELAITLSGWALLAAIAAVGLKSSLKSVMSLGGLAVCLVIGESLFLAAFVFTGIKLLA